MAANMLSAHPPLLSQDEAHNAEQPEEAERKLFRSRRRPHRFPADRVPARQIDPIESQPSASRRVRIQSIDLRAFFRKTQRARAGVVPVAMPRNVRGKPVRHKTLAPCIGAEVDTLGGIAVAVTQGQIPRDNTGTGAIPFIAAVNIGVGVDPWQRASDVVRHIYRPAAEQTRSPRLSGRRHTLGPGNHGQTHAE